MSIYRQIINIFHEKTQRCYPLRERRIVYDGKWGMTQLAEQCLDKTGLFYDEKMNRDVFETHNKTESSENKNPFANFDFSPEK